MGDRIPQQRSHRAKYWNARVQNGSFLLRRRLIDHATSRRRLRILFSSGSEWQRRMSAGFRFSRYQIDFDGFSPANVGSYDALVPLSIADAKYLTTITNLTAHNLMPLPSLASIELCDDKLQFNRVVAASGFGDLIPSMDGELAYPYLVKKRVDKFAKYCFLVRDAVEAEAVGNLRTDPDYITQAMVVGTEEYAAHILIRDGEIIHAMTVKYVFDTPTPIKGQDDPIYTLVCPSRYLDVFAAVLKSIGFEGLCCVNYKVADGRPMIFEINPRFGGSLSRYFVLFVPHLLRNAAVVVPGRH